MSKIFKKIKERGILDNPVNEKAVKLPPQELLESGELIDAIKYYRLRKGMSRLELCNKAGVCDTSYRYYEAKSYEIQDYRVAEKLIHALGIEDKVEMPDEFKIKKYYPMDKILEIITKYGKREFSKRTGISELTINTWFCKRSS